MKRVDRIRFLLSSILCLFSILLVIGCISKDREREQTSECILKDDFHIMASDVKKLQTEENAAIFLQEQDGVLLENSDLERTALVTEVAIIGNSGILFPNQTVLDIGDVSQCLISSKTAYSLFGTDQLENAVVTLEGIEYHIIQVIPIEQELFVHEVSEIKRSEVKNRYFSVLFYNTSLTNEKDAMDQFLMKNGFNGKTWKFLPYFEKMQYLVESRNTLFQISYLANQKWKIIGIMIFLLGCSIFPFYGMINILSKVGRMKWIFMKNTGKNI